MVPSAVLSGPPTAHSTARRPTGHTCNLLIIDSANAEPYTSFRRAMLTLLETEGCGGEHGLDVQRYSAGNQAGLARRIWRTERPQEYDAVIVQGTIAAREIHSLTAGDSHVPIFFGNVTDPVDLGLIDSFSEPPPRNFTGVSFPIDIAERIRFVREVVPHARTIGLVHTSMPQARSYNRRLREVLRSEEFADITLVSRVVPYVPGENGVHRSVALAREHIRELDRRVDVFLSANDQMGVNSEFVHMVSRTATSPLIGVDGDTVGGENGAVAALYSSTEENGRTIADMILQFLNGAGFATLHPREPEARVAIDHDMLTRYDLQPPEGFSSE